MGIPTGNDVYILSDLHLGEGYLPTAQRYSRLETFFYDVEFQHFVHALIARQEERRVPATLVLNGDIFDFLAIVRVPDEMALRATGIHLSAVEQEFGLGGTEEKAVWRMDRVLRGHPRFVLALAELLSAGNFLVINRGNHDAELFWPSVQRRIIDVITQTADDEGLPDADSVAGRIEIHQWFYFEAGRFYIEHGNQYEASNAFRHVMQPLLPEEYDPTRRRALDYPMGSLFVRFLYNKMKLLDPFTTHFVTLERYVRVTYHHNFMDLLKTGTLHFPFFFRAIREARVFEQAGMGPIEEENQRRLTELGKSSGLGDKVFELEKLMPHPVGTTKYNLLKEMLRPVVRAGLTFLGFGLLSLVCWFFIFAWMSETWLGQGLMGRASVLAIFAVLTVVGLFLVFSFVNRALHSRGPPGPGPFEIAERIAKLLEVPNVSFGHTHNCDLRAFPDYPGKFCNTGTWIPNPGPWDSFKPYSRQFTFAIIRGNDMKLRRWNTESRKWEPVLMLEDYHPTPFERLLSEGDSKPASTDDA